MRASRRTVIKGAGATGGAAAISRFISGDLSTLAPDVSAQSLPAAEEFVPTTCWIGKQDCGLIARKVGGRLVKLEGHPDHPRNRGTLCPKGAAQIQAIYDPNRVKTPLQRTNEKGVPGKWKAISWEDALNQVAERVEEARSRDPKLFVWQKGRSKAKSFYDKAFVNATGALKLHHGAYCSDAAYRGCEYNIGFHGGLHPDFNHTRYLLSWGWGMTAGGGNKMCQITWHQELLEARERGIKVIQIDPMRRNSAQFADEWMPIKPGTDVAFFMALCNVLVENGFLDQDYLRRFTNSPFLVKSDGTFVRSEPEDEESDPIELVWDRNTDSARPHDGARMDPALTGEYVVNGETVRPSFEHFVEHIAGMTPEWAAPITGLPAADIRRIGIELGENAMIGSTTVIDGVEVPYRPVALMGYHVSQQELGFQAVRAAIFPFMLLGAIEVVGGLRSDFGRAVHKNFDGLDSISIGEGPYNLYLNKSKFFPINSNNSSVVAHAMLDPEKYELDVVPEVMIIHMANPVASFLDQQAIIDSYMKLKFVAVIDPWLSETADLFGDIVLPAATIEKYEGPLSVNTQYKDAKSLRVPPIDPLFESRGEIDIYLDLCEKLGNLYGEGGYLEEINKNVKLKDEYALDLETKPEVRQIFDNWARQSGYDGVEHFETAGITSVKPVAAEKYYAYAWDEPYGGIKHRFYGESLMGYSQTMQEMGVDKIFWQDYTAYPQWRPMTMDSSPDNYDLTLISYKKIEFKQARSTFIPLVNEIAPTQALVMNPRTAEQRGLAEGDTVMVESHNAVSGATRRIETSLTLMETIRPDTVAMSAHYGMWTHPWTKEAGPTPNTLFFSGPGYVTNTADQSYHVKVRVQRTEE